MSMSASGKKRRKVALGPLECAVGEQVRKHRNNARWTQKTLAKKVGLSQPRISHYETGKDPLPLDAIYRISEALDVPICRFFGQNHD